MSDPTVERGGKGVDLSKRRAFKVLAGAAAGAATGSLLNPSEAWAQQVTINQNTPNTLLSPDSKGEGERSTSEFNWDELHQLLDQLHSPNKSSSLLKASIKDQLRLLEYVYDPRIKRVNQLIDLADLDNPKPGSLGGNARKFLGGLADDRWLLEGLFPFFREKRAMVGSFSSVQSALKNTVDVSDENALLAQLYYVGKQLGDILEQQFQLFGYEKEKFVGKTEIHMDPNIQAGVEGWRLFDLDVQKIRQFFDRLPFLKKFASRIFLTSYRYGYKRGSMLNADQSGTFDSQRDVWQNRHFGRMNLDMDIAPGSAYWPEVTFAHESGHMSSAFLNPDLVEGLTPSEVIERFNYELQIANNTDWGGKIRTIDQLFRRRPLRDLRSDIKFATEKEVITTEDFVDLTTEYPTNVILYNNAPGGGAAGAIVDSVKNSGPYDISNAPLPRLDGDVRYNSLDSFLKDYQPILQKSAKIGNIKAQIVLWGLEQYREYFNNYGVLWSRYTSPDGHHFVPTDTDKTATTWSNYLGVVVSNAVIFHAFVNKLPEANRWLPNPSEFQTVTYIVKNLLERYRDEMFAEGIGWSYYFGDRMKEKPPHRGSLEHVAALVDSRSLVGNTAESGN